MLLAMLAATVVFGWRWRQLLFPTAFASGVLLVCDAWFDVLTSQPGTDFLQALGSALLLELPLAFVLIAGPLRLMRYVANRHGLIEPGTRVWRMPKLWPERPCRRADLVILFISGRSPGGWDHF